MLSGSGRGDRRIVQGGNGVAGMTAAWQRFRHGMVAPGATGPTPMRALVAVAMFGCGLLGFARVYRPDDAMDWIDCLFRTGQLVVGQFPAELVPELGEARVPIPIYLNLARFGLPALVLWVATSALVRRIRQPARAATAGLLKNHLIVAGEGGAVAHLVAEARRGGQRCVVVTRDGASAASAGPLADAVVVAGEPTAMQSWRGIGLGRARAVVVTGMDDAASLGTALAAAEIARAERGVGVEPLDIVCRIDDADLHGLLDGVFRGRDPINGVVLHATSAARVRARALLAQHPLHRGADVAAGQRIHALVIGCDRTGEEIALQVLRTGMVAEDRPARVTVVDPAAAERERGFRQRAHDAPALRDVRFVTAAVDPADPQGLGELLDTIGPVNAIFVCVADDTQGLLIAIAIRRWAAARNIGAAPIHCHQRSAHDLSAHLADASIPGLDLTRLHGFGSHDGRGLEALAGERLDRQARRIHERYLRVFGSGDTAVPSQRPWPLLGDLFRQANRDQADYLPIRLACLGLAEVECRHAGEPVVLSPAVIEAAARTEHLRWMTSAQLIGWRQGPRNTENREHPDLVEYDALDERAREKDRAAVREAVARGSGDDTRVACVQVIAASAAPGEDADGLAARMVAAIDAAGDAPVLLEATLASGVEAAGLRRALGQRAEVPLRLRPAGDLVRSMARWTDPARREDGRWLLHRAEQVLWQTPGGPH